MLNVLSYLPLQSLAVRTFEFHSKVKTSLSCSDFACTSVYGAAKNYHERF